MSKCPEYYRASDGREFWEFFRDDCHEIMDEYFILNPSQSHALESACEYLFRAGIKTVDPRTDVAKAFCLFDRIMSMESQDDVKKNVTRCIREVVGCVLLERAKKHVIITPLADPIVTAWGRIDNG